MTFLFEEGATTLLVHAGGKSGCDTWPGQLKRQPLDTEEAISN